MIGIIPRDRKEYERHISYSKGRFTPILTLRDAQEIECTNYVITTEGNLNPEYKMIISHLKESGKISRLSSLEEHRYETIANRKYSLTNISND